MAFRSRPPARDRNPARVYLASLTRPVSRRRMLSALMSIGNVLTDGRAQAMDADQVLDVIPWHHIRYQHVAAVKAALTQDHKPASVNAKLSALRGVVREAFNLELINADVLQRIRAVQNVKASTLPAGRVPVPKELQRIFDACKADPSPAGSRDAAIIALMVGAGLRRAEVASLNRNDYNGDTGELVVRGKGRRERIVPLINGQQDALHDWLAIRGDVPGPLFWRINKGGRVIEQGVSVQVPFDVLVKRSKQAGIQPLAPHDMRRTFGTYLLDAGADVFSVQKLMGHAQTQTTLRYDRRDEKAKRKAIQLLTIPY